MVAGRENESLKPGRRELTLLAWAFGLSLIVHLLSYGTYNLGKHFGWWQHFHTPTWLKSKAEVAAVQPQKKNELNLPDIAPTVFIETTPRQTVAEPPKDAKFYSDKNTAAANPDADKETDTPKIDGSQTKIPKTEDTKRSNPNPMMLQPSLPQPELRPESKKQTAGDLAFAKPNDGSEETVRSHPRPRTLAEAMKQQSKIVGEKMKQDGGVRRRLDFSSVDAKATPFGAYDAAFIEAVQQRWYDLLDSRDFVQGRKGRVTLEFRLHYDGRVTDMTVVDTNVGDMLSLLCQKAVLDPAPFAAWPSDMRHSLGDSRQLRFTFYYE